MRKGIAVTVVAAALLAGTGAGVASAAVSSAPARGTFQSVVHQGTAIFGNCAVTARTTTAYYRWSATSGWVPYPVPVTTTVQSTACHRLGKK
jgi:hypothetical protein